MAPQAIEIPQNGLGDLWLAVVGKENRSGEFRIAGCQVLPGVETLSSERSAEIVRKK